MISLISANRFISANSKANLSADWAAIIGSGWLGIPNFICYSLTSFRGERCPRRWLGSFSHLDTAKPAQGGRAVIYESARCAGQSAKLTWSGCSVDIYFQLIRTLFSEMLFFLSPKSDLSLGSPMISLPGDSQIIESDDQAYNVWALFSDGNAFTALFASCLAFRSSKSEPQNFRVGSPVLSYTVRSLELPMESECGHITSVNLFGWMGGPLRTKH